MTYRSRNDKDLLALLSHYERTVRAFDHNKLGHRQRPYKAAATAQANYLAACDALLKHIETTVNDARDEGARNPEHYNVN